ncbi:MAG: hypothetical protein ACTSUT_05150 [Promethearchaeota archaeon]
MITKNFKDIGRNARELDKKSISERAKLSKHSIKKIIFAIFCYFTIMTIFYFFL